jgi:hypothetical protein
MTHIEQRYGTAAEWAADNTILHTGEVGWETDTRKSKLGESGVPWNDLDYTVADVIVTAADVGLDQVDNTSDDDKPVSAATSAALGVLDADIRADLAPKDSPVFTGNPTAPTPLAADDDTSVATTEWVRDAFAALTLLQHPVGRILFSADNVNPGTYMPGSTWVAFGSGRVPVGVDAAQVEFDTAGETGGAKTHTHALSDSAYAQATMGAGAVVSGRRISGVAAWTETFRQTGTTDTPIAGQTNATPLRGVTDSGSNLPPYITCYMWKRTA